MLLEGDHLCLRPWRHGDESAIAGHANNPNVARNLRSSFPHPYTLEHAQEWVDARLSDEGPCRQFAIEVDGEAAGSIGLTANESSGGRVAEVGYWLAEPLWGRGLATEAVRLVTAYGFGQLGHDRVCAWVFGWNPASARVLEKCGYILEGTLRRHMHRDGLQGDLLVYGLLREEWVARSGTAP